MIIVDVNQIMISNLMVQINGRQAVDLNEDFVRHMILNSLRAHNKKFRKEYGQMVIACVVMYGEELLFLITRQVEKQIEQNLNTIGSLYLMCLQRLKKRLKTFYPTK